MIGDHQSPDMLVGEKGGLCYREKPCFLDMCLK